MGSLSTTTPSLYIFALCSQEPLKSADEVIKEIDDMIRDDEEEEKFKEQEAQQQQQQAAAAAAAASMPFTSYQRSSRYHSSKFT